MRDEDTLAGLAPRSELVDPSDPDSEEAVYDPDAGTLSMGAADVSLHRSVGADQCVVVQITTDDDATHDYGLRVNVNDARAWGRRYESFHTQHTR